MYTVNHNSTNEYSYEKKLAGKILRYLMQNMDQKLVVSGVASHFEISSTSLQRLCRKHFHKSFGRFMEHIRLTRALKLLKRGTPIKQVMYQTGYIHRSSFHAAFTKKFKFSPGSVLR